MNTPRDERPVSFMKLDTQGGTIRVTPLQIEFDLTPAKDELSTAKKSTSEQKTFKLEEPAPSNTNKNTETAKNVISLQKIIYD